MRGVTRRCRAPSRPCAISTRTPHAGSDLAVLDRAVRLRISTRTPHAGSDFIASAGRHRFRRFQPALPMRGVTIKDDLTCSDFSISTRTPHAGSDTRRARGFEYALISTRTPHAGSDLVKYTH